MVFGSVEDDGGKCFRGGGREGGRDMCAKCIPTFTLTLPPSPPLPPPHPQEYQSAFVQTQMFSSYVDKRRGEDLERARTRTRSGVFLAACLGFKWRARLRRRLREEGEEGSEVGREGVRRPFQGYVVKPSGLRIEEEEEGEEGEEEQEDYL
jgi:hypothetical protein